MPAEGTASNGRRLLGGHQGGGRCSVDAGPTPQGRDRQGIGDLRRAAAEARTRRERSCRGWQYREARFPAQARPGCERPPNY